MLAVSLTALGIIGAQVAVVWWLVRRSFGAMEQLPALKISVFELRNAVTSRDGTISGLQGDLESQVAARKRAEEAARHAIDELAKSGSAPAIVSALNERLQALSRLSDVPANTAGKDSDGDKEVHGAVPGSDGPNDTRPG